MGVQQQATPASPSARCSLSDPGSPSGVHLCCSSCPVAHAWHHSILCCRAACRWLWRCSLLQGSTLRGVWARFVCVEPDQHSGYEVVGMLTLQQQVLSCDVVPRRGGEVKHIFACPLC